MLDKLAKRSGLYVPADARLGLASTQSTAVSAAARAAVPRVAQQHGVPPVKVPHSLLEDVAVVSQLRRVR